MSEDNVIEFPKDHATIEEVMAVAIESCKEVVVIGVMEDGLQIMFSGKPSGYEVIGLMARAQQAMIDCVRDHGF